MSNNNDIIPRSTSQGTTISNFLLDIGYDCSFGHGTERENIADGQVCFFASIDELASIHSFVCDESFCAEFVAVGITEGDFGERSTSTGVVDDFLDNTTEVAMSFSVLQSASLRIGIYVENSEFGSTLSETGVRLENTSRFSELLALSMNSSCGTSVRG